MRGIVPDEQRGNRPKSARPAGVAPGSPPDGGAPLERATGPACETLLAGELPGAIMVGQYHGIMLYLSMVTKQPRWQPDHVPDMFAPDSQSMGEARWSKT